MNATLFALPSSTLVEDERYTTRDAIDWCKRTAGVERFDLDVAACDESHHAERYYTRETNGLIQPWFPDGVRWCWMNPPYSDLAPWFERVWDQAIDMPSGGGLCALVPGNRTEQKWWQSLIEPHRDGGTQRVAGVSLRSHFVPGRTSFARPGSGGVGQSGAPFGCVLLVWRRS
jgi:hypothetical protein